VQWKTVSWFSDFIRSLYSSEDGWRRIQREGGGACRELRPCTVRFGGCDTKIVRSNKTYIDKHCYLYQSFAKLFSSQSIRCLIHHIYIYIYMSLYRYRWVFWLRLLLFYEVSNVYSNNPCIAWLIMWCTASFTVLYQLCRTYLLTNFDLHAFFHACIPATV